MTDVATIGTFDGFHLGHRAVVDTLLAHAREHGMRPVAITFSSHPLALLRPEAAPPMLTTPQQRKALLERAGVAEVRIVDFGSVQALPAAQFLERLRREGTGALVMGFNNRIGSDRLTAAQAAALGIIPVVEAPALENPPGVSSSAVRQALSRGDVSAAARMLGRPYKVRGTVVHGKHLGHTLGFPTANIDTPCLLPASGVYAVEASPCQGPDGAACAAEGAAEAPVRRFGGMANIGTRPTFCDGDRRSFEVNIFGFDGNLYGRTLEVAFIRRLRDERRFDSAADLRAALAADRTAALSLLESNTPSGDPDTMRGQSLQASSLNPGQNL